MKPKHPVQIEIETKIRSQHKEQSTADAYWGWVKRYFDFCAKNKLGKDVRAEDAVTQFLTRLANIDNVSANTQNQAFAALCYFYGTVRNRALVGVSALRAKRDDAVRSILNQDELIRMFDSLSGIPLLVSRMMYASGFRIGELGKLRVKDIDFERCQIQICRSKHGKTRTVKFPEVLHEHVQRQVDSMRVLHAADKADGLKRTKNLAGRIVEASPVLRYNYSLLLQGLASWVSRFYFQMGKRTGQHCCARSLTSVRQPVRFTRLDWRSDH